MLNRRWTAVLATLAGFAGLTFSGCTAQIGPRDVVVARSSYADAIVRSGNEQMLLNLVRLRYRDIPLFLEMGSVVTHYSFNRRLTASAGYDTVTPKEGSFGLGGELGLTEDPTISYTPLQGEDFVRRLLSPLSPSGLVALSGAGWSVERLMLCCVQNVNGVTNAISAAGPTPDFVPKYEDFHRLAKLLRELQVAGRLSVEMAPEGEILYLHISGEGDTAKASEEIHHLLGLDPAQTVFKAVPALRPAKPGELAILGRSLLGVMFFLSQAVEVPALDAQAGKVTVTHRPDGSVFEWTNVTGKLFRVQTSEQPPKDAAVAVPYRGHWFYIADNDLNSKTTFSLLSLLFSLKSGNNAGHEPMLTLGVN